MFRELCQGCSSPLEGLRTYAQCMAQMGQSPHALAHHLAYLQLDLTDPDLYQHLRAGASATREELRKLIDLAIAVGELVESVDAPRCARSRGRGERLALNQRVLSGRPGHKVGARRRRGRSAALSRNGDNGERPAPACQNAGSRSRSFVSQSSAVEATKTSRQGLSSLKCARLLKGQQEARKFPRPPRRFLLGKGHRRSRESCSRTQRRPHPRCFSTRSASSLAAMRS